MFKNFKGTINKLASDWKVILPPHEYENYPINYLEIGVLHGANVLSVASSYAQHKDSKLYCIDPWDDYDDKTEYKVSQNSSYEMFISNICNSDCKEKVIINRGLSNIEILKHKDNYFDIIYIDGNHEPEYVLEDAVLSFRKLKIGGVMIFDDYGWGGPDLTQRGIDAFVSGYHKRIEVLGLSNFQVFVKKIR
jgi:predicted O-methyltransferase YrrM